MGRVRAEILRVAAEMTDCLFSGNSWQRLNLRWWGGGGEKKVESAEGENGSEWLDGRMRLDEKEEGGLQDKS